MFLLPIPSITLLVVLELLPSQLIPTSRDLKGSENSHETSEQAGGTEGGSTGPWDVWHNAGGVDCTGSGRAGAGHHGGGGGGGIWDHGSR